MDNGNKWAFWGAATLALLLVCLPSTFFIESLARYQRYLSGVDPYALRPTKMRFLPHRDGGRHGLDGAPKLEFVEFRLRRPKAKTVGLIGDFNGWKEGSLALARRPNGRWELSLPMGQGRHHYLFVVDGRPELDADNPQSAEVAGRRASVKIVP